MGSVPQGYRKIKGEKMVSQPLFPPTASLSTACSRTVGNEIGTFYVVTISATNRWAEDSRPSPHTGRNAECPCFSPLMCDYKTRPRFLHQPIRLNDAWPPLWNVRSSQSYAVERSSRGEPPPCSQGPSHTFAAWRSRGECFGSADSRRAMAD